jgi:hypothetical protein
MDQCLCCVCPVDHGMNMICFLVCNNVTARCGEFDYCVAIWAVRYVTLYCLIFGPTCEATKDIFGFVLTDSIKKSSMVCPSINTFGCRRDVILDGIVEKRVFSVVLCMEYVLSLVVYIFFCLHNLSPVTEFHFWNRSL